MPYLKPFQKYTLSASVALLTLVALAGCTTPHYEAAPPGRGEVFAPQGRTPIGEAPVANSEVIRALVKESEALAGQAQTALGRDFLYATRSLPTMSTRSTWRHEGTGQYLSAARLGLISETEQAFYRKNDQDEYRYYHTKYGSPLGYFRTFEIAAKYGYGEAGAASVAGTRVFDFGFGSVAPLRMLASMGVHATGVDVDSYLEALYSQPSDQGRVANARNPAQAAGSVTLAFGSYPRLAAIKQKVGGNYDLIISKNTLKRGYIKPERAADKKQLIDLGASDVVFLRALFDALKPGGKIVIYNLSPKQAPPDKAYIPWADGRSPFTRDAYQAAGFKVLALDESDDEPARAMGRALGWDKNERGEVFNNLSQNLFALYTVLERPVR